MEVNKGEAERCRDMGAEALRSGNYARAVKLFNKSLQLFPLPGVEALKGQAERKMQEPSTSGAGPQPSSSNSAASSTNIPSIPRSSSMGSDGRAYTEDQEKIVKEVLKSKEGGRGAHYRVLGVESNATENDLKKAYRRLALKLHPDKNSAPHADEAFKAVGLAYATLSDSQKRTIYDRYGDEDPDNRGGSTRSSGVHFHGGQEVSPEDIFNMFFGGGMGGMRAGPGGFVYTSNGGFARRGGGFPQGAQFRQQARAQQQARQEEVPAGLGQFVQFLPLIFIMLLSFFNFSGEGSTTGGNKYFSLTRTAPFINPLTTRLTPVKDIPYFVTDKFMRTYYRDRYQLAQVERMVEKSYENYLVKECKNQRLYKKQLLERVNKDTSGFTSEFTSEDRERQLKKARDFELTRCVELQNLFPKKAR